MTQVGSEIIVVDDDIGMSQAIERLLTAVGWKARSFVSAEEFLASNAVAALLILDIQLPGISGLELHRNLLATGGASPVIFITAQDQRDIRNQALQSGAVAYFTKPFAGQELIRAVRQYLPAA